MAVLFRVRALYEYSSPHEDDLNFPAGQIIAVTEEDDDDWYGGEYVTDNGAKKEGIFPRNFVEKYEPVAPPRPMRKQKQEQEAPPPPRPEPSVAEEAVTRPPPPPPPAAREEAAPASEPESGTEEDEEPVQQSLPAEPPTPAPAPAPSAHPVPIPAPAPLPANTARKSVENPTPAAPAASAPKPKPAPPPVSEKPSSFKDRIAAFNKPAAPPVAPFKPSSLTGGGGSSGFIKKPFVAPPPSRNAYVPPPREAPSAKVYRRDEDPEIQERVAENTGQAERAGLVPHEPQSQQEGNEEEDQPKPTSLKERIALLQKQQMEQAQRHADAAAKKEKPKKPLPPKKKAEVPGPAEESEGPEDSSNSQLLERRNTEEPVAGNETDETHSVPVPPVPRRQSADTDAAAAAVTGDTTGDKDDTAQDEDNEPTPKNLTRIPTTSSTAAGAETEQTEEQEKGTDEEEDEEDEEDEDPEVRRREELRARMAKMSGGMGFHGMFGPAVPLGGGGGGMPKKKAPKPPTRQSTEEDYDSAPPPRAPPVPTMMALPGLGRQTKPAEEAAETKEDELEEADNIKEEDVATPSANAPEKKEALEETRPVPAPPAPKEDSAPPPVPVAARPPPPPVPTAARPPPPPVPAGVKSATEGSESDDELSSGARENVRHETTAPAIRSPPLPPLAPQSFQTGLFSRSPPLSPSIDAFSPTSPGGKRASRPPPPVPGSAPALPPIQTRPPPPPPPGSLSRQSTADATSVPPIRPPQAGEATGESSEYEGDYDTDIVSSILHRDALTKSDGDSSFEGNSILSPTEAPADTPPPIPSVSTPRAGPPSIPAHPASSRKSMDATRGAPILPPPIPPKQASPTPEEENNYDHSYIAPPTILSTGIPQESPRPEISSYFPDASTARSPPERRVPPPLGNRPRASLDGGRNSLSVRRSVDQHRPSMESGFIASDIDLAAQSGWWKQANQLPPVLQGRKDVYFECDESSAPNQGGTTTVTRSTFVLFQDYSQTIITASYDPYDPSSVELEQRHEGPPRSLRQDQMEEAYDSFGRQIAASAASRKDQVVADGTSQGFVLEMLRPLTEALAPISTRSYGALVYSNMANASTQQHDVIRPGDIITIRNAKFQGKHGPMHAKYSMEVGKPDHVGVVAEWDGTKKKVRAWEQGRESKKVKQESYKLDDLRSGEVKIWRVVARSWVGWQKKLQ